MEQVATDLHIEPTFSTVGRAQGRGNVERFFGTANSELLPELLGDRRFNRLTIARIDG